MHMYVCLASKVCSGASGPPVPSSACSGWALWSQDALEIVTVIVAVAVAAAAVAVVALCFILNFIWVRPFWLSVDFLSRLNRGLCALSLSLRLFDQHSSVDLLHLIRFEFSSVSILFLLHFYLLTWSDCSYFAELVYESTGHLSSMCLWTGF